MKKDLPQNSVKDRGDPSLPIPYPGYSMIESLIAEGAGIDVRPKRKK